jgi:hypothetical protein
MSQSFQKTEQRWLFLRLFQSLKNLWPDLNPELIHVDYELAIHIAIGHVWHYCRIQGCFFHLYQNLQKHLATAHLTTLYQTNPTFALNCRMIISLAFLPQNPQILSDSLRTLEDELLHLYPNLEPIIDWFTTHYVGRLRNNGTRAPPTFIPSVWNVHDITLNGFDRTNNFSEAFHKKVQLLLGVDHPNIWLFLTSHKKLVQVIDA